MSTRFVKATNKVTNFSTMMHDDDAPLELFLEVDAMNKESGQTMNDWIFTSHNYRGEETGTFDWKDACVTVTLGELFT